MTEQFPEHSATFEAKDSFYPPENQNANVGSNGQAPAGTSAFEPAFAEGPITPAPFTTPVGQGTIEEVFLTPRVIDQSAFTRYSETLKTLIREASGSGETLRTSANDANALLEETRAADGALRSKIELGAKLVKTFDERMERTRAALDEAAERAERIESLDSGLEQRVTERLAALEEKLAGVFDSFESRANQAEQRLVTAEQTALRHTQKLEEIVEQLEQRLTGLEQRSGQMISQAEAATSRLDERSQTITHDLESRAADLSRVGEPAQQLCRRTLAALGIDPDNPGEHEGQAMQALIASAERAREDSQAATVRLAEVGRQADESRSKLANALVEASERVESLTQRSAEATRQAEQGVESLRATGPEIERTISSARERLAQIRSEQSSIENEIRETTRVAQESGATLSRQRQDLEALLDASIQRLGSRVEEAGAWLGGLITRAAQTGQALERIIQRTGMSEHEPQPAPQAPSPRPASGPSGPPATPGVQGSVARAVGANPGQSSPANAFLGLGLGTPSPRVQSQTQTQAHAPAVSHQQSESRAAAPPRSWAPPPELPRELRETSGE